MKNIIFCFIVLSLTACAAFDRPGMSSHKEIKNVDYENNRKDDTSSPRKRLMILPFLDVSDKRPQSFRDHSRSAFIMDLNRSGRLIALDSENLHFDSSKLSKDGQYKLEDLAKEAQGLGVNALLEGKILDIRIKRSSESVGLVRHLNTQFEVVVQARIMVVRSRREIFNTVKTVTLDEQGTRVGERVETDKYLADNPEMLETLVKDAFLDFTPQIISAMDKISWEGRIAAINGDRIYLNVGKVSGLQIGDLLKVLEEGDDIYDPENGSHLGRVPGRLKGTLEVISYFGNDGAISVVHSGAGFKENDRVELY